jgi:hypothetical protein
MSRRRSAWVLRRRALSCVAIGVALPAVTLAQRVSPASGALILNPHLVSQKRENELVTVLDARPELLGIGLDDDAAVLVRCGRLEPLTRGRVAIYDDRRHGGTWYYWLDPAQQFDLRTRRVIAEPVATTAPACR